MKPRSSPSARLTLALWKPEKSFTQAVKKFFGIQLARRITLPGHLQLVASQVEEVLGQQRHIKESLDMIEQRIRVAQMTVSNDWVYAENIGGSSPMKMSMKTDNYDSKTIKGAIKASNNNLKKVNKLVSKFVKAKKREKDWKSKEVCYALASIAHASDALLGMPAPTT